MRLPHVLLALLVMAIWGFSFVAIEEGLQDMPPMLLCCLRFFFTCFPAIFFIKKPKTSWGVIASYGILMFVCMFSFTFLGMHEGITPSLAAILIQLQVFFSIFLAMILFKEHITRWQILGALISFSGLIIVGFHLGGNVTLPGLLFMVLAGLSWGFANLTSKKAGKINMLGLIVWGSLFAWPILLILALTVEGGHTVIHSLRHITLLASTAVIYMAYPATLLGFSTWSWLLSHHRAATVTPFTLLVPFFAMLGSMLIFKEPLEHWKLIAAVLIMGGLCVNIFGSRLRVFLKRKLY